MALTSSVAVQIAKTGEDATCGCCGRSLGDFEEKCFTCGNYVGPPNVRAVNSKAAIGALEQRYASALVEARHNGVSAAQLTDFENQMTRTRAVINADFEFLQHFVRKPYLTYTTYQLGVDGQIRKPAQGAYDRQRGMIESALFGSYARQIRYGAVSLDGSGCKGYGPFSLTLSDVAVRVRTTVLEENSYLFWQNHIKDLSKGTIPLGYMATWQNRGKLAVVKLGRFLNPQTTSADYQRILLKPNSDRTKEEFLETHIFGTFDISAIEEISGPADVMERAEMTEIVERLGDIGIKWIAND